MVCRNFILSEFCKPCLFFCFFYLRNLFYLIKERKSFPTFILPFYPPFFWSEMKLYKPFFFCYTCKKGEQVHDRDWLAPLICLNRYCFATVAQCILFSATGQVGVGSRRCPSRLCDGKILRFGVAFTIWN